MKSMINKSVARIFLLAVSLLFMVVSGFAQDFPDKPNPPRLVNDLAHVLSEDENNALERKLLDYEQTSSCQITIVTITSIGSYDVSDYTIKLGKQWHVGQEGKNNGVVLLLAMNEKKIFIATGKGMEGALPDIICNQIIEKIKPVLKQRRFYDAFSVAADDIISATKGEFKGNPNAGKQSKDGFPAKGIVLIVVFVIIVIFVSRRGGGGNNRRRGGGSGFGDLATGLLIGNMLGGGFRDGGNRGGDSGGGGGGFGGFGGGDFGGGGAGGSWD